MEMDIERVLDILILDRWLTNKDITLEEIAKELKIDVARVKKTLNTYREFLDTDYEAFDK